MNGGRRLRYLVICFFLVLVWYSGIAQKKDYFEIQAIISVEDGILEGTTIDIELNEKEFQHFSASKDGKFVYRLKFNNEYKLTFAKPGFYTRIILISTVVPQAVLDINSDFPPIEFQVNILKEFEGVDKSFSLKPFAKIAYDRIIDDFKPEIFMNENMFIFQLDEAYTKKKELEKEKKALGKLELQELQEMQKEFDRIIQDADGFFDQLKYDEALAKYQEANKLFPDRPYPIDRIREIQNLLDALRLADQNKQEINKQYKDAIDRGDAKLRDKIYSESLASYKLALQLKPDDNYAQKKIDEVEAILKEREKEEQFAIIFAQAEDLFNAKDYKQAREVYRQASLLIPDEPRPNERITEINNILQQLAAKEASEQSYQQAIEKGDRLADQQKYDEAITEYRNALEIKANDSQVLDKIKNVEATVLQKEKTQVYETAISEADKAFRKKDYQLALNEYKKALSAKSQEKYPQDQLNQISNILAAESAEELKNQQYASYINSGDSLLNLKNYQEARLSFVKAGILKPTESYPGQKIKEIDKIAEEQMAEATRLQQLEARYNQAISRGDQAYNDKRYDIAKIAYNEALIEKPNELYPSGKVEEINSILDKLAAEKSLEQNYQQAIQEGDRQVGLLKYEDGITEYKKALALKANDQQTQGKILLAEEAIKNRQHQIAYESAITEGDKAFRKKDYTLAESEYRKAQAEKPEEQYPKNQLLEIANIQAAKSAEELKNQQYASYINSGDSLLNLKNYQEARLSFVKAGILKPTESYPGQKIKEIDKIAEELMAEATRLQQLEARYNQAISRGDQAYKDKRYDIAKFAYNEALIEKPNELYPSGKIEEINSILDRQAAETALEQNYQQAMREGDRLVGIQKYEDGITEYRRALTIKENDRQAQNKISEAEDLIKNKNRMLAYEASIAEADKAFKKKDYELAKSSYEKAQLVNPEEQYPKNQLSVISNILADEAAEKLKNQQYTSLIQAGDSLYSAKNYVQSKSSYLRAGNLYPQQNYPKLMIARIDKDLEDIAAREEKQKQIDLAYNQAISRADQAFGMRQNDVALIAYNEALDIKPNEPYPTQKIAEINKIIQDEMQNIYQQAITEADRLFAEKNYAQAIDEFRKAIRVKANDEYANKRISEANELMLVVSAENARLKKIDDDYNRILSQATDAAQRNDLRKEKEKLTDALALKPDENYPKSRISEIDIILEEQRIAEENSRLYAENMKSGQNAFNEDRLDVAKTHFQDALKFKPEDALALQRMEEVDNIMAQRKEIERLLKLEEEQRLIAEKANKEKYDRAIADADNDFGLKRYNEARAHYVTAMSALPGEQHPKDRIKEIDSLLDELKLQAEVLKQKAIRDSIDSVNEQQYQRVLSEAENFASLKKYEDAIAKFNDAIDIMPNKRSEINTIISELRNQMLIDNKLMADYQSAIAHADDLFNSGQYDEARIQYTNASSFMPDIAYPKDRIAEIQKLKNAKNEKYSALIAKADESFKLEKWQSSKNNYIEALDIIPEDEYATNQLQVINQKMTLLLAADVERSLTAKAFEDMIKQAEELYASGKLYQAKNMFDIAKTLKPDEIYPEQKITEIEKIIEVFREDSLKLVKSNEEDNRYGEAIVMANQLFRNKAYKDALSKYEEAIEIKPEESYPQKQIELINQLIAADQPIKETVSKPLAERTYDLPQTKKTIDISGEYMNTSPRYLENLNITETNKLYDETIRKANELFINKDYSVARFFYYKASDIKPSETQPKQRIEEIGRLIDLELSADIVSAYESNIRLADDAFSKNNYSVAKFYYYKAQELKSWERYPKDRIHEIQVLTNSLLSEREERLYNDAIAQADEAYYAKNFSVARFHYNQALKINPQERYPKIKIEDIRKLIEQEKQDQVRMEYMNQLQQADKAFGDGNFSVARFYYNKALGILKNEQYPKDQLKRIEEFLSKRK